MCLRRFAQTLSIDILLTCAGNPAVGRSHCCPNRSLARRPQALPHLVLVARVDAQGPAPAALAPRCQRCDSAAPRKALSLNPTAP